MSACGTSFHHWPFSAHQYSPSKSNAANDLIFLFHFLFLARFCISIITLNPAYPSPLPMEFPDEPIQSNLDGNTNPLHNLSTISSKIDTVIRFLSDSINQNTRLTHRQMNTVSSEISTAIHQIIANASTLIASTRPEPDPESEIVELDAVELLAEHIHFCEICGKGFKRDANLRMHMRAHGNQFKTPEALAKPVTLSNGMSEKQRRFSCPYEGCCRNKKHKKFRALKSVICVKNHFKRSHCPKMYSCNRCNKKSFSVLADLKSHLKHCGEAAKWTCSCGTRFSRKDKLFGHVALFEGHMPAVVDYIDGGKGKAVPVAPAMESCDVSKGLKLNDGYFESFLDDGFGSIENRCLRDVLGISNNLESDDWEFCDF